MSPDLYTDLPAVSSVDQTAEILGCSTDTVYNLVTSGKLGSLRLGRSIRVPRHRLIEFLSRTDEGPATRTDPPTDISDRPLLAAPPDANRDWRHARD